MCHTLTAMTQENRPIVTATNSDTAKAIVDNFLRALNYEALPADSMLYIESSIFDFNELVYATSQPSCRNLGTW